MAARGPNPARGTLKIGPQPGTDKRKKYRPNNDMYLSNDPLVLYKSPFYPTFSNLHAQMTLLVIFFFNLRWMIPPVVVHSEKIDFRRFV